MSKLSRRDFLKAAVALTTSRALAWKADIADASPVVEVDKAVDGDDSTEFFLGTFDDEGKLHARPIDGQIVEEDTGFVELVLDDDGIITYGQSFAPYSVE